MISIIITTFLNLVCLKMLNKVRIYCSYSNHKSNLVTSNLVSFVFKRFKFKIRQNWIFKRKTAIFHQTVLANLL